MMIEFIANDYETLKQKTMFGHGRRSN